MTIFNDEQLLFTLLWIFTIMKYKQDFVKRLMKPGIKAVV